MIRTGLLGGTFDPVHMGHIGLACNAYAQCGLDEIWMLVSPDPPHKRDRSLTPFKYRFSMIKLAAQDYEFMKASDYETGLAAPHYTARTLAALRADYPDREFCFIIGEDSLNAIDTWYHPEDICAMTQLIVAVRSEAASGLLEQVVHVKEKYSADIQILSSEYVDISSTDIRKRIASGDSVRGLVPEKVEEYIWKEKLYTI